MSSSQLSVGGGMGIRRRGLCMVGCGGGPLLPVCCGCWPHVLCKAQGQTSSPGPLGKQLIKLCSVPERWGGDVPSPRAGAGAGALHSARGQGGLPRISVFEHALTPRSARGVTLCPAPHLGCPSAPTRPQPGSSKAGQWGESLFKYDCCYYYPQIYAGT